MQIARRLVTFLQKQRASNHNIPFALMTVLLLSFGLMIPWLGFYHDEWHFLYNFAILGPQGTIELFNYDGHPLTAFLYILSFKLVGFSPLAWHIYSLIWRWLAVTMFWLLLDNLWPEQKRFSFIASLLFAIYPLFVLQILPISYYEVWVGFFLIFLSFLFTVQAVRQPDRFWLFTTLAIVAKFGQMFTSEYTWGMELMRPIIVWFLLPGKLNTHQKILQLIKICLPYLAIFATFGLWRTLMFHAGRKEIAFQSSLLTNPFSSLASWLGFGLSDAGLILFTSWYDIFRPAYLDFTDRINLLLLVLVFLSSTSLLLFINKLPPSNEGKIQKQNRSNQAILIGLSGLAFGLLPSYAAGYTIYLSAPPGNTRFGLGALPGAALIIAGLMETIIASPRARNILAAILIGLSISWHVRYTNEFRGLWKYQANFYRQLVWRAPALNPGTALISVDGFFPEIRYPSAILAVSGDYPTAMAINTIYGGEPGPDGNTPYWVFIKPESMKVWFNLVFGQHLNTHFTGELQKSLFFSFKPEVGQCLHFLSPADDSLTNGHAPEKFDWNPPPALLEGINVNTRSDFNLLDQIIGPPDLNNWCYFYEKAELAKQREEWEAIVQLWNTAAGKNLRPANGLEYLPFIDAYAQTGNWAQAFELTKTSNKISKGMDQVLCDTWARLQNQTTPSQERDTAIQKFQEYLTCN